MSVRAEGREFSRNRDLPPLKLAAADLDTILRKAHSLVTAANGPSGEHDFGRETVKLGVRGKEIEVPHFSLASSVAFPKEVFRFSYTYYRPISRSHASRLISTIIRAGYRLAAHPPIRSRQ
jgi:hypothetical protein